METQGYVHVDKYVTCEALIVNSIKYQENHKIVTLLTREFGKITAMARGAVRSVKRFSGGLQICSHVTAHLEFKNSSREGMCQLKSIELINAHPDLARNYLGFEAAVFGVAFFKDLYHEGDAHVESYNALLRYLAKAVKVESERQSAILKSLFWAYVSQKLGYGILFSPQLYEQMQSDPDGIKIKSERDFLFPIYQSWLERSDLKWPYFENWMQSH